MAALVDLAAMDAAVCYRVAFMVAATVELSCHSIAKLP